MGRAHPKTEIVYDTSDAYVHRSRSRPTSSERRNFMSRNLANMYSKASSFGSGNNEDSEDEDMDINKILQDIEYLGSSNMSWKERKELENRKVVALGGKPPKRQRLPLSVAKVPMKRQKLREEKKLQEDVYVGRFQKKRRDERSEKRRNSEDGVLMASEGYFKKGVLDVKHLLKPSRPKSDDPKSDDHMSIDKRKKNGKGKKKGKGKKRGGKKKRKH